MTSFSLASATNIESVGLSTSSAIGTLTSNDLSSDFMLMTDQLIFDDQLASSFFTPGMFDSFDCNFDLSSVNVMSNDSSSNEGKHPTLQSSNISTSSNESRPIEYFCNNSLGEMGDVMMGSSSTPNEYTYRSNVNSPWNMTNQSSPHQSHLFNHSSDNLNKFGMGLSQSYPIGSNLFYRQSPIYSGGNLSGINSSQNSTAMIKVPIATHRSNVSSEIKKSTPLMLPFHHKNDNRIIPVRNFSTQHQVAAAAAYLASTANTIYSPNISSSPYSQSSPFQITLSIGDIQSTKKEFLKRAGEIDYSNITVVELKNFLREFHQASGGKKADLVERIRYICNFLRGEEVAINSASSVKNTSPQMSGIYPHSSQLPYNMDLGQNYTNFLY